jgi:hypothetical protein
MSSQRTSSFAATIQDHLEFRRRNSALEHAMPLWRYMDPDERAGRAHHGAEGDQQEDEDTGVL